MSSELRTCREHRAGSRVCVLYSSVTSNVSAGLVTSDATARCHLMMSEYSNEGVRNPRRTPAETAIVVFCLLLATGDVNEYVDEDETNRYYGIQGVRQRPQPHRQPYKYFFFR